MKNKPTGKKSFYEKGLSRQMALSKIKQGASQVVAGKERRESKCSLIHTTTMQMNVHRDL